MSKKEKVDFTVSDQLASIDEELDAAMLRIDQKNIGIDELLKNLDLSMPSGAANAAELEDDESAPEPGRAAREG